jgi:hypothetical protein
MLTLFKNKQIYFALAAIVLITTAATFFATDFSGEWTLNETKSNFGDSPMGRTGATSMKVTQEKAMITITRNGTSRDGQAFSWDEKLPADGKEVESTANGNRKRKSSVKWSDDKKSFTVSSKTIFEREGETMEITSTEVFKLSDDGKTLTVEANTNSSFGSSTRTLVYDKK